MFTEHRKKSVKISKESTISQLLARFGRRDGFSVIDAPDNSFVFLEPVLKIWADVNGSYVRDCTGLRLRFENPWEALQSEIVYKLKDLEIETDCPCVSGFFAYEFLHECEQVNMVASSEEKLPYYVFYAYRTVLKLPASIQQNAEICNFSYPAKPFWTAAEGQLQLHEQLQYEANASADEIIDCSLIAMESEMEAYSNFKHEEYLKAVSDIKESILDGEVYQVNLSQKFRVPYFATAEKFALVLRKICPAPHGAYLSVRTLTGFEGFTIVSASPESFFSCSGNELICSPIKGTRPRYIDTYQDQIAQKDLISSQKDLAELAMIVDLVRNDMGRIAEIGSVEVLSHARLESHPNVHHLVSDVRCRINREVSLVDILRAMFPCGSVTGAPKIAAMNIISKMERTTRGVYTGAIGMLGPKNYASFNVAIRTALVREGLIVFNSGGAVVVDSNPESEYEETMAKASSLYKAWKIASKVDSHATDFEGEPLVINL